MLLPTIATAYYNPQPDTISRLIGTGVSYPYAKVYYICDKLPNGTVNSSGDTSVTPENPTTPYQTYAKALSIVNTLQANEALAFCRGGRFYQTDPAGPPNIANANATAAQPIVIRDYMPDYATNIEPPEFINIVNGKPMFRVEPSGREGVTFLNLHIRCGLESIHTELGETDQGTNYGIRLYQDVDYVTIDNLWIEECRMGVIPNGTQVPTILSTETLSDLTFTHNADPNVGDTISRASGTWTVTPNKGDGIIISGSSGGLNDADIEYSQKTSFATKKRMYRVQSATSTTITLTQGEIWDVVDEANTPDVTISVTNFDRDYSFITLKNSRLENMAMGVDHMWGFKSLIDSNIIINNGFTDRFLHHNVYITGSDYMTISNNIIGDNAMWSGNPNNECEAVQLVAHGQVTHLSVIDNLIYQRPDKTKSGCWGISINKGYAYPEWFSNTLIARNTIINGGNSAIGCTFCTDTTIEDNVIVATRATALGASTGIAVPDTNYDPLAGGVKTGNVIIRRNRYYGKGTSATSNTSTYGIWVGGTATNTEGTIEVYDNVIDSAYKCLNDSNTGGFTKTWGSNTTTNCTVVGP